MRRGSVFAGTVFHFVVFRVRFGQVKTMTTPADDDNSIPEVPLLNLPQQAFLLTTDAANKSDLQAELMAAITRNCTRVSSNFAPASFVWCEAQGGKRRWCLGREEAAACAPCFLVSASTLLLLTRERPDDLVVVGMMWMDVCWCSHGLVLRSAV